MAPSILHKIIKILLLHFKNISWSQFNQIANTVNSSTYSPGHDLFLVIGSIINKLTTTLDHDNISLPYNILHKQDFVRVRVEFFNFHTVS